MLLMFHLNGLSFVPSHPVSLLCLTTVLLFHAEKGEQPTINLNTHTLDLTMTLDYKVCIYIAILRSWLYHYGEYIMRCLNNTVYQLSQQLMVKSIISHHQ